MSQFSRPNSDVSIGTWTTKGGGTTNLYQEIDETSPDDETTYIVQNPANFSSKYLGGMSDVWDPLIHTGWKLRFRARKRFTAPPGGSVQDLYLRVELGQSTTIHHTTNIGSVPTPWTSYEIDIPTGDAASFSPTSGKFQNMRIRVAAESLSGTGDYVAWPQFTWAEIQFPNVTITPTAIATSMTLPAPSTHVVARPTAIVITLPCPAPGSKATAAPTPVSVPMTLPAPLLTARAKPSAIAVPMSLPNVAGRVVARPTALAVPMVLPAPLGKAYAKPSPIAVPMVLPAPYVYSPSVPPVYPVTRQRSVRLVSLSKKVLLRDAKD